MIPLYICGFVLGGPYHYHIHAIFRRRENKYHIFKEGIEYIVRAHRSKTNMDLINASHLKRLINSSKRYFIMVFKKQPKDKYDDFQWCNSQFKVKLVEMVDPYREFFK